MTEAEKLISTMLEITGASKDDFFNSRSYPLAYARAIVANELRIRGYLWKDISVIMNKSHSNLITMISSLDRVLELKTYKEVKELYNEFQSKK